MKARFIRYACLLGLLSGGLPSLAGANGRMPGASDTLLDPLDPEHIVVRATFGVVQSFDGGKSWKWICEQAIGTNGVVADPPTALLADGTLVLLPPTGGALLSRDRGCSWDSAPEPLAGQRGVDLTLDPGDGAHLLVLMSTLDKLDEAGFGVYRNFLIETRDSGATWKMLSELPSDFEAETVEMAASDRSRMYVSGTASKNPRLGIVQRSDDGGVSWMQGSFDLPAGTGSLLISAIHPELPDRLWLRVPARGDTIGVLPARLYLSDDKGQSFHMLASTQHGMFGFALSPDGAQLAYGGPSDGLYVGPSDGTGEFSKVSSLGIRCLRWTASGDLYACGTEPANAFSLGISRDRGASFEKLYALTDTCPQACSDSSSSSICEDAWQTTQPLLRVSGGMCEAPPSGSPLDAGKVEPAEAGPNDAATRSAEVDANLAERTHTVAARSGCSCRSAPEPRARTGWGLISSLGFLTLLCARSRWRSRRFV